MGDVGPVRDFDIGVNPPIDEALRAVQAARVVAVDVETPRDRQTTITIFGMATSATAAWVWAWSDDVRELAEAVLGDPGRLKVGHNFAFDTKAFHAYGIDVAWPVADTIQAASLLWPPFAEAKDRPWLRLPWCVNRVMDGIPYWKQPYGDAAEALYRTMFPRRPDWQIPLLYCGMDALLTWRLWAAEREILEREGMLGLFESVVAPAAPVLIRLEERGLPLDDKMRHDLEKETEGAIRIAEAAVRAEADVYHDRRVARIDAEVTRLRAEADLIAHTCPVAICVEHPDYCGQTKRAKCAECGRIYAATGEQRRTARVLRKRAADGRDLLRHLGPSFSVGSDDSWRWLLFDKTTGLGLRPTATTRKRRLPQVDDDAIEALQKRHPTIGVLRQRVEIQHARRRLSNVLGVQTDQSGNVPFAYSMHRTETGRIASGDDDSEPEKYRSSSGNAQNIPDQDRVIYAPIAPERVFVQADWSQAEARVLAWLAKDRLMLAAFARGEDIYSIIAAGLYRIAPDQTRTTYFPLSGQPTSARQIGKKWRLARNYGMGPQKWAKMTGMTIREAMRLDAADRAACPRLYEWQEEIVAEVEASGALTNPFGRTLRFHRFERAEGGRRLLDREEALAFLPQSTVGDMCKIVLPLLDRLGERGVWEVEPWGGEPITLRTTTHDSFLFECHQDDVGAVEAGARRIMEKEWEELGWLDGFGRFVCPVDVTTGRNWGSRHEHDPICRARPGGCPKRENLGGLQAVSALSAAASA